ncbi:M56 family metallopeptidase [Niabella yanshanensis]|uniref:M56 family metallopeptidase n=1 Tax=Niabella yanshanensis TaxID=577386 RepID=A0ABZ0W753_9BACT|nr:M56 family metallopeptidase [Niabella yanshanensis]WQD39113.1 M56 family metallopeptidase [Niabella yanshanensis]
MATYLLQMIACSGILYGYYHFFLRNEKFHQYNRFYLLFAMALSLLLPLLKIPVIVSETNNNPIYNFVSSGETVVVTAAAKRFAYTQLLYVFYGCVVLWMLFRLLKAVFHIISIKKAAASTIIEDIRFIKTSHPDAPFSFFRWLFWHDRTELESKEGMHMFKHEMYHIRSKHSFDLLFTEIILSFCWFNPFFYIYRKELKTIQEFLADQHAASDSDAASYAELLLIRAIGARHQQLINPFFHNQLKRRITMLTSSKKPQYQWLRKLLVLPVAATAIALFAFTYEKEISNIVPERLSMTEQHVEYPAISTDVNKATAVTVIEDTLPKTQKDITDKKINDASTYHVTGGGRYRMLSPITVTGFELKEPPKKVLKEGEIKVDVDAAFKGNWISFMERNLDGQIPTDKGAAVGNYEILVRFTVNEDGKLSDIQSITNEGYGMEEEVIRILKKSPDWYPAINNNNKEGKSIPVKSYRIQQVNFKVVKFTSETAEGKSINLADSPSPISSKLQQPEVFTKVEIDAAYPGNWRSFLEKNLNGVVPVENGAKPGNYTTIIQFIVDKDGTVSDIKPLTKHGYGMEEEAMRVIKASGKWAPAIQNKREVKAYRKQPITFQISLS